MSADPSVFSARLARDEDLRAAAAEYDDWLDAVNAAIPDPAPACVDTRRVGRCASNEFLSRSISARG